MALFIRGSAAAIMRAPDSLPPIWQHLQSKLQYIRRVSDTEWSAECLACGGSVHPNGEWPDRMRIFADDKPLCWCRRCGQIFWPDDNAKPANSQLLNKWRKEQEQRELARKRSAERALENLRSTKIWERYHDRLGEAGRTYWERRGISPSAQDFWQLGWRERWVFIQPDGSLHQTPSATIPVFGIGWVARNVKHRLIHPPPNRGKYIYELYGQKHQLFLCQPDKPLNGRVIAVEGEIKGMVLQLHLGGHELVVGLPGTSPGKEALEQLSDCESIVLVMDPGSEKQAHQLAEKLGKKRCRTLITPVKIDDGILAANLSQCELRGLLRTAIPA